MKYVLITMLACAIPASLAAQNMTAEQMQQMQEAMNQAKAAGMNIPQMNPQAIAAAMGMGACVMNGLGEEGMQRMEKRGNEANIKIVTLCKEGKTKEAEALARQYAAEMQSDPDYKVLKGCGEQYKDALATDPQLAGYRAQIERAERGDTKDICKNVKPG